MEKLNELVEQAKFVTDWHGSEWSSALCQDKDGKQAHEIICESRGEAVISIGSNSNEASWLCDYLKLCSPANILAISEAFKALKQQQDAMAIKWKQVSKDGDPALKFGESALYWVCYRSKGHGQLYVTQAVWFNQPEPEDYDETGDADCYVLYSGDGEPYWPVGWHQTFCHEDFSTYYLGWDCGEIVAYAELNAPSVPYHLLTGKDGES